jgi:hydrogenase nickel incorporation protein HypA/HybF
MHELSICRALIGELDALAARHRARGILSVRLRVGPLSGVEPSLLRSAFPFVSAGTCAEGAALVIDQTPLRVACDACGAQGDARPGLLRCEACGDWRTRLVSGDELVLESVQLHVDPQAVPTEVQLV